MEMMGHDWDFAHFDAHCCLMLDVTLETLRSDPDLLLCEGLRLIDSTRTAVARMAPSLAEHFDRQVLPILREVLMHRFGVAIDPAGPVN
jgi:hypothetical protein